MVPELSYINNNVEAYIFGKSLLSMIRSKEPEKQRLEEKEFLSQYFKLPKERIFFLEQVHGFDCIRITDYDIQKNQNVFYYKGDALITNLENVILCIRTADCLPIFLHTNNKKEQIYIGIMHVGWRGLYRGIIQNTIQLLLHSIKKVIFEFKVEKKIDPENIIGYPITIFPGVYIPKEIYEVGKEVADLFVFTKSTQNGKYLLDLWENSNSILQNMKDYLKFQINDPFSYLVGDQVAFYENFFSHRRGDILRNLNVIFIKK